MKVELLFIVLVALATRFSAYAGDVPTADAGYQGEGLCTVAHRKG
jgi:hypothetical protein